MRSRSCCLLLALALATSALGTTSCRQAQAEGPPVRNMWVEQLATTDSARYVVHWLPSVPTQAGQVPIAGYLLRVVHATSDTIVADSLAAAARVDTVAVAYPPVGGTYGPLRALVAAVDTMRQHSAWAISSPWSVTLPPAPPNPPDSVTVDSSLAYFITLPRVVAFSAIGDTVRLCEMLVYRDSTTGYAGLGYCDSVYEAWSRTRRA